MERKRGRPAVGRGNGKPAQSTPLPGLRQARERAGESQAQAGAVVGVNKSHMGKIEQGQVRLDVGRALALARHYGITVEQMAEGLPPA